MAVIPSRYRCSGGNKVTHSQCMAIIDTYKENEFEIPKFVQFIAYALSKGYKVHLYDAQTTVSKYVTIINGEKKFKVRFSNHKPNKQRQLNGDCDFFVGHSHGNITTTRQAWFAMVKRIGKPRRK